MNADPRPQFIPGLELSRAFYREAVRPVLDAEFPGLPHAAALMGYGSDVLGFDTPRSTDHNWGPRLQLFLAAGDLEVMRPAVDEALRQRLPLTFRGYPVNFSEPDALDAGTQCMEPVQAGPVRHLVEIDSVPGFFRRYLSIDLIRDLEPIDWLLVSEQALLEVTMGVVFYDGLGTLQAARARFAYYPRDVWLYRIAGQWQRIGQEEPFVGRCGEAGDDLGSRIIAARLVRDQMRLAFLLERRYAPYSKWLGTAFGRLACSQRLTPIFEQALAASDWRDRQDHLADASAVLAGMHNDLGIGSPVDPTIRNFFGRPYRVIFGWRFAEATRQAIVDSRVKAIAAPIGGVDQFSDNVDLLDDTKLARRLKVLYE